MRLLLSLVALLLTLISSVGATAGDEVARARAEVTRGQKLFELGQYREAAAAFAAANALVPDAGVYQNEGLAWEEAGEAERAADAYEQALQMGILSAEFVGDTRRRLQRLEHGLAVLIIAEPKRGMIIVGDRQRAIPTRVHVRPGAHDIVVTTPAGLRHERRVEVAAGDSARIIVPPDPVPEPRGADTAPAVVVEGPSGQAVAGYVLVGVGGVAAIVSLAAGIQYLRSRSAFYDDKRDADAHAEAKAWQVATTATFYPGIGLAALGLVLVLTAPSQEVTVAVSPLGLSGQLRF